MVICPRSPFFSASFLMAAFLTPYCRNVLKCPKGRVHHAIVVLGSASLRWAAQRRAYHARDCNNVTD